MGKNNNNDNNFVITAKAENRADNMRISTTFNDFDRVEVESAEVCVGVEREWTRPKQSVEWKKQCVKIEMEDMIRCEDVFFSPQKSLHFTKELKTKNFKWIL